MGKIAKIVVCPDSFKGSLSAKEVCKCVATTIRECLPGVKIIELPLADGGEGTAELLTTIYPLRHELTASDPTGRQIQTFYHTDSSGEKVFIESAEIIGLPILAGIESDAKSVSSFGLGEVIKKAIENGGKEITVSLGGSATSDGGMGMLSALGFCFRNSDGDLLNGKTNEIGKVREFVPPEDISVLKKVSFRVVCDVENPLLGDNGAVYVYGPQKGLQSSALPEMESGMRNFARKAIEYGYAEESDVERQGAGAAGGLGFAFLSFLKANYIKGIDFMLASVGFDDIAEDADLIITGEGSVDRQSVMGKVVGEVWKRAKEKNIPFMAICGKIKDYDELKAAGLTDIYEISRSDLSEEENMKKDVAETNLKTTIREKIRMSQPKGF